MKEMYTFHTLAEPLWDRKELAHDGDIFTTITEARAKAKRLSKLPGVVLVVLARHPDDVTQEFADAYRNGRLLK